MDSERGQNALRRPPTLVDVVDRVLNKGIVIEAHVSVAVAGLELATVEAQVVVASIDTYLGYKRRLGESTGHVHAGVGPTDGERYPRSAHTWDAPALLQEIGREGSEGPRNRIAGYLADDIGSGNDEEAQ